MQNGWKDTFVEASWNSFVVESISISASGVKQPKATPSAPRDEKDVVVVVREFIVFKGHASQTATSTKKAGRQLKYLDR